MSLRNHSADIGDLVLGFAVLQADDPSLGFWLLSLSRLPEFATLLSRWHLVKISQWAERVNLIFGANDGVPDDCFGGRGVR